MTNIITLDESAQRFWMRIDRVSNEALVTAAGQEFAASNFMPQHTGGGCMAWERPIEDTGWRILVTNSGGSDLLLDGTPEDYWLIGAHGPDGEWSESREAGTVADALVHAEEMHWMVATGQFAALNIDGEVKMMRRYEIDRPLRGPEELGHDGRIPADWHVDLVGRILDSSAHFIVIQFGSVGVSREDAQRIVERILAGLNGDLK